MGQCELQDAGGLLEEADGSSKAAQPSCLTWCHPEVLSSVQEHWQSSAPGPGAAGTHPPHQEPQGGTVPLLPGAPGAAGCVGSAPSGALQAWWLQDARDDFQDEGCQCCRHLALPPSTHAGLHPCRLSELSERRCWVHSAASFPLLTGTGHPAEVISALTGLSQNLGRPPAPELRDPGRLLPPTIQPGRKAEIPRAAGHIFAWF